MAERKTDTNTFEISSEIKKHIQRTVDICVEKFEGKYSREQIRFFIDEMIATSITTAFQFRLRYGAKRMEDGFPKQTVAEHLLGMDYLQDTLVDLNPDFENLDWRAVSILRKVHDFGEIGYKDIPMDLITEDDKNREEVAAQSLKSKMSRSFKRNFDKYYTESQNPQTPEGKFMLCLDKFEPDIFFLFVFVFLNIKKPIERSRVEKIVRQKKEIMANSGFEFISDLHDILITLFDQIKVFEDPVTGEIY